MRWRCPACAINNFESDDVLIITTAYEQGVGHANRPELSNPYTGGDGRARLAWDLGREFGKKRAPSPSVGADGLPELPAPKQMLPPNGLNFVGFVHAYTADQMRAYALAALAARTAEDTP